MASICPIWCSLFKLVTTDRPTDRAKYVTIDKRLPQKFKVLHLVTATLIQLIFTIKPTPFPVSADADVIQRRSLWSVAQGEFSFPAPLACFPSLPPSSISHILLAIKPTPEYVRSLGPSASFVLLAQSETKNLICFSGGQRNGSI